MVVGGERSQRGLAEFVVVPDRGGEGEDALQYSRCDARDGPPAVAFEVELGLERVIDRLDDLPKRFEVPLARPWFLALAGRPQQLDFGVGECSFECLAVVVLSAINF